MPRKISIQMIADQLGLSKYAVSRALSGKSGVSQTTRERVLELARTLGYELPRQEDNTFPTAAGTASSFVLIFINQSNQGEPYYWQRVLGGLISGCNERGWHHVIVSQTFSSSPETAQSPQEAIAPHLDWSSCLGLIVLGSHPYDALQRMARTGKPLVLVDHSEPLLACDSVNHANIEAGITVTRHLLYRQCRKIVFLGDNSRSVSFAERRIGARLAVERYGSKETKLFEWELSYEEGGWQDAAAERLAHLPPEERPDAWIGANDDIALQWMRKLQQMEWSIPDQCRVAGIDNVEAAALASPRLTTVNLCKEELGTRAIESLQRRIERPGSPSEKIQLSAALIPRDSA
ncbi:LacI family DNA-binding transcriptional regulator [Paenibacillus alkaliterrae]|uniref:LacI family DNA-binding transcriptional regulator n=1 Tax=Paenibacillus alkaliterrae TaxID=320909 RepID=UPI001F39B251|nr:LacI family DNA-binding transcriptional regulator [Paenibacillus alkaliterrae]MCF2939240.1 LacI family DNA-binding transcriptional regulator [Paenibacillus alkaliterrae]